MKSHKIVRKFGTGLVLCDPVPESMAIQSYVVIYESEYAEYAAINTPTHRHKHKQFVSSQYHRNTSKYSIHVIFNWARRNCCSAVLVVEYSLVD